MKNIVLIILITFSLNLNGQSFSDYKDYLLSNEYFKVKPKKSYGVFNKNNIYYCKVIRENKLESGYLFILTDGNSMNVEMNETEFIKNFKGYENNK